MATTIQHAMNFSCQGSMTLGATSSTMKFAPASEIYLAKFNAFPVEVENVTKNQAKEVAVINAGRGNIFVI